MTENDISEDLFEQELSLLLLYLASWTEGKSLVPRAWKNHRFEIVRAPARPKIAAALTVTGIS